MTLFLDFSAQSGCEYSREEISVYEPPYANALHESFAWHAAKYFSEAVSLRCEVAARAENEEVTLDFVAQCGARTLAFWCDDDARYDINARLKRDAALLRAGVVDAIYRLRSSDLAAHLEDCFYLLSRRESEFFSERGVLILGRLASNEARCSDGAPLRYNASQDVDFADESGEARAHYLEIVALHPMPLPEKRFARAG